jgi:hypothetical protein
VPATGCAQGHGEPLVITRGDQALGPALQVFGRERQIRGTVRRLCACRAGQLELAGVGGAGEECAGRLGEVCVGKRGVVGMAGIHQGQPGAVERDDPAQHGECLLATARQRVGGGGDLGHLQSRERVLAHGHPLIPGRLECGSVGGHHPAPETSQSVPV